MTALDPRTPVIIGAGQLNDRDHGSEPIDLMTRCTEAALTDTGAAEQLRSRLDAIRVVWGVWPYRDPGRLVAERLGAPDARSTMTASGGNQVYDVVIDSAARIQAGDFDAVVVCGAESLRTRRADRRKGTTSTYISEREGAEPDEMLGVERPMTDEREQAVGLRAASTFYAMAETALRHRLGEDLDAHRHRVAELWARASRVAADNPAAWTREALDADHIATESASNRPIASPYPKLMTSNLNVDQGGAVIICSVATAEAAGVPTDRWVFPWAGASATDPWFPTNRWAFDESPGMQLAGGRTLELAGVGHDDCSMIDLYSCFPVAVQVAQRGLELDPARDFTITGGLTFAAGPLNCYCLLPLTRAVGLLRSAPGELAFLTGNGGFFTKHNALVLGARPSGHGFRTTDLTKETDAFPTRPSPVDEPGAATLETYTVVFDRDRQPEQAVMASLDADGRRHWASSTDAETMGELLANDCCERPVELTDGVARLAD